MTVFIMELQRVHFDIGFELLYSMEMKSLHKTVIQYYFHKLLERKFFDKFNYFLKSQTVSNFGYFWQY